MSAPRFLIAKYAPDLRRMEPRNIGVIVWSQNGVAARFLGESPDGSLSIPRLFKSRNAYRQWITFWRGKLARGYIKKRDGSRITVESPEFVDELRMKSKRLYMLVDGGFFTTTLESSDVNDAADELFSELVSATTSRIIRSVDQKEAARMLRSSARRVVDESGMRERIGFFDGYDWLCPVGDTKQHFHFDYALHTTHPTFIIEDLPLWRSHHVHSTAFRFQAVQSAYNLNPQKCVAFVYATEREVEENDSLAQSMILIDSIGSVINVTDVDKASADLRRLLVA